MKQNEGSQNLSEKIDLCTPLIKAITKTTRPGDKKKILEEFEICKEKTKDPFWDEILAELKSASPWEELAFLAILAIGQESIVFSEKNEIRKIIGTLSTIERFYERLGGIVGYYIKALTMIVGHEKLEKREVSSPPMDDITQTSGDLDGIRFLPNLAEIYPIGGLGDRLNLRGIHGEPLPAALLPFCGRSLLEGLIRDVQGREYLYFKLFDSQIVIPIALMTSSEKENENYIRELCVKNQWFGRSQSCFFIFSQLSVPVVTAAGNFSMKEKGVLNLHPAGHGALWRTAEEKGVYKWLEGQKKDLLLIRQINNPIAGIDNTLLAIVGKGGKEDKIFGFASCKRLPKAAEGVLVLSQASDKNYAIINIEYTDFEKFGIEDVADVEGYSLFPTNTNLLFANLKKLLPHIHENPLPGLVLNMKSDVPTLLPDGTVGKEKGGRLESMMQSIAENLVGKDEKSLPTFVTYNERLKTISTTKRSYEEGKSLLETPQGAFYDLMKNGYDLLKTHCGVDLPPFSLPEDYLRQGPSLLLLYHPALGPLFEVIKQKIRGGKMQAGAELQLEIADLLMEGCEIEGSLLISAQNVMGEKDEGVLRYSERSGKCFLKNVVVKNRGMVRDGQMLYWKNEHSRHESLKIHLEGMSEFHAEDVTFEGSREFVVPHGERWVVTRSGVVKEKIEAPTWVMQYRLIKEEVKVFVQRSSHIVS